MLEASSPLGPSARYERDDLVLAERADFTLTQVAGDEKVLKKHLGKLPAKIGAVVELASNSILRIGPKQFWVLGNEPAANVGVFITPLSSSRTRIAMQGPLARQVLAACALIDFDISTFKPGQFVLTGIHHTPVMIQCIEDEVFHIFALRTFALNVWEWLCDVAEGQIHA
jgi:heterotetrameric sarcosine oxidase gamma subunit